MRGHVPCGACGLGDGFFAGQADVAQHGVIKRGKGFALAGDRAGRHNARQQGRCAARTEGAGEGQ